MAERTGIAWTDATFNPWWGCTKVSPGCDNCYAERDSARFLPGKALWGLASDGAERRAFGDKHWNEPRRWARSLPDKLGRRPRVFCASMADVFDKDAPRNQRERLWTLIEDTPSLDWLILTKRVGNVAKMIPAHWRMSQFWPRNVWLGISVVNQEEADRDIPKLLKIPAAVQWLSIEPMLGPVDLRMVRRTVSDPLGTNLVDWVVVGGESGPRARSMADAWALDVRKQCDAAGVPYFFKQQSQADHPRTFGDFKTFPLPLQVREFPEAFLKRNGAP